MDFLHILFRIENPCLCVFCCPPVGNISIFRSSAGMLHGTDALQHLSFHTETCRHFQSVCPATSHFDPQQWRSDRLFHAFDLIAESDPQTIAPTFFDVLLDRFSFFFQTLPYRGYPGKVLSPCYHPSSSQHPRQTIAVRVLWFWKPVHHIRGDVFVPVAELDDTCSLWNFERASNVFTTCLAVPDRLLIRINAPADMFVKSVWSSKCRPC